MTPGTCKTCGVSIAANRFYCDDHRRPIKKKKDSQPKRRAQVKREGSGTPREPRIPSAEKELQKGIQTIYEMAGQIWSFRDPRCGGKLLAAAPGIAEEWVRKARTDDAVRRFWVGATTATGWGAIVFVHLPVIQEVATHHVIEPRQLAQAEAAQEIDLEGIDLSDASQFIDPSAPPEMQEQFAEAWQHMTDEERHQALAAAQARFGTV